MNYRIKIFCNFANSENCKNVFEKINYANEITYYGKDKRIYITADDDFTHAIIINNCMPNLSIPKENVIGLAFEPTPFLPIDNVFINYAQKHISKYFIGNSSQLPYPFIEHFAYMWHSRPAKEITVKNKIISIAASMKKQAPGHKYRHLLIEKIIENRLPVDIYGYGCSLYNYEYIKGTFNDCEPYEDYMFSICIENYSENDYFSEKIITPLLFNCNPIYYGCKNIDNYFNDILKLSFNVDKDIEMIANIIKNPELYWKKTYTEKNLKTVNLIENIEKIFAHN
jgi:hypothetical protein